LDIDKKADLLRRDLKIFSARLMRLFTSDDRAEYILKILLA
jgi:hypothetical protein